MPQPDLKSPPDSKSPKEQLPIPPIALRDKSSFELLRVWIAEQGQHVSLRAGVWEDPFAWGVVLADLAGHIVNATIQNDPTQNPIAILDGIRNGFDSELDNPTDEPTGSIST